ncbi:MAG: nucleotide exchange factor GrpE [Desulfovibrio sp.]|nr:nucleotide exchange factor GrpE [Desulfovibrio sp.]
MQRHKMQKSYGEAAPTENPFSEDSLNFCNPEDIQGLDGVMDPVSLDDMTEVNLEQNTELSVAEIEARCKAEVEETRLRMAAEMDNFQKRLKREHDDQVRYAADKVLSDLLPSLDNLELALQYGSTNEVCKDMVQGVAMTHKLLLDAVSKYGLKPVGEEGEEFNPALHEAVGFDARPELAPGSVARVLQRGYKLGERLLRPAKVMVTP